MNLKTLIISICLTAVLIFSGCSTILGTGTPDDASFAVNEASFFVLEVSADIPEVHIYVDGNFIGNKEVKTNFRTGVYRVEVKAPGYETYVETVNLIKSTVVYAKMVKIDDSL